MRIILDEREDALFQKISAATAAEKSAEIIIERAVLNLGDIVIKNAADDVLFIIERKSFADLVSSVKDGRYDEQSYRLTHSSGLKLCRIFYVIEGVFSARTSRREKQIIYSAMTSLAVFKGFSVQRTTSLAETAEWILFFVEKIVREEKKGKFVVSSSAAPTHASNIISAELNGGDGSDNPDDNLKTETPNEQTDEQPASTPPPPPPPPYSSVGGIKQKKNENITPENIGEILLCQIPSIQHLTAVAIMRNFTSFADLIEKLKTDKKCLDDIRVGDKKRRISKTSVDNIIKYLLGSL